MTNYSKLSDVEIAERVCVKLGCPDLDTDELDDWIHDTIDIPFCDYSYFDCPGEEDSELMRMACFDWPAPIMMQKVEEWLVGRGIEIHSNYCQVDKVWTYWLCGPDPEPSFDEPESTGIKPRALYEAFLQVEE